eukprot:TRINITY_DN5759_c0_g1_i1.p1 TRINITY_DN5759_c0_g1~~TRINITY_DN5759_c0_g1_i1.p1  ORF type:complete len:216 (-),score=79.01 TRINITY_DN5759_c0_g1_i1:130-747(-)
MSAFWPTCPDVGPGAKATTILTNLQRGNVPTQNISSVRCVDVYQRAGQGDLDRNDLAGWLMETGDDIDRPDVGGMTMMMWAAAYGQTPTVQMLINHGASVHTAGKEMETPLHLAASCGCHELIMMLLRHGAQVDCEDENSSTPTMFATMNKHPHCVHELIASGADVTKRNINGDTAYSLAVKNGARNVQTVLENYMLAALGQPRV